MDVKQQIEQALHNFITTLKNGKKLEEEKSFPFNIDIPRNRDHGDFSTNLPFLLAKELKIKPALIAEMIKEQFDFTTANLIERVEIAQAGYLNFFVKKSLLEDIVKQIESANEDFGKSTIGNGQKVLIEFVSANPTGPLNVVSARAASVGDALANVLNQVGYNVGREFYVNDFGVQAQLFGESLKARYLELFGKPPVIPENGYHGEYLITLANRLFDEGVFSKYSTPEEITFAEFTKVGLDAILLQQKNDLEKFGVTFDLWYRETNLHKENKPIQTLEQLKKAGYVFESEGAVWFKSTEFGDEKDRVLVKSDGNTTYFLNDIAYHQDKFERGHSWLIDLWGPDHHGHVLRMKAAMQALGYKKEQTEIIIVQQVNLLRDGQRIKMSKRAGQIETMTDLINEVGVDAARFFFLLRGSDSHLDFDLEVAKHQTNDNPVFYVQYAHARVCSIFQQAAQKNILIPLAKDVDLSALQLPEEADIIKTLIQYPDYISEAARSLEPQRVVRYLMELSTQLHQYYNQHRVISEDEKLTQARLVLMKVVQIVVRNGLRLVGVSSPERM